MRFFHLADLHLGKRVNGFSMLEDQRYILKQILELAEEEKPKGVLIAGDVYDKPIPPAEAVELFDRFLVELSKLGTEVFVIAGNHDSAERLSFGSRLMDLRGVHVAPVYDGTVSCCKLQDEYGSVAIYLLPFLKPVHVRHIWPDAVVQSYTNAVQTAVSAISVDLSVRNILVTHQFVTGSMQCDSEELSVGGSDHVDAEVFDAFDYVALGHLHSPQNVGRETLRYAGSPLKYSFSEVKHHKSVTVVELAEKGTVTIRTLPLNPMRDMAELRGTYEELTLRENVLRDGHQQDYVHITLTDEEDVLHAAGRLQVIYPWLMKLDYDNRRTSLAGTELYTEQLEDQSPEDLVSAFYEMQNGVKMNEDQYSYLRQIMTEIWEGEE